MKKQALVIGLGQFGMSLARSLSERSFEVIAVDIDPRRTAQAREFAEAIELDATDLDALKRVAPERRHVCVCAFGESSREASILCTTLLKEQGVKNIVARASDDLHGRILQKVGATLTVNPESEAGEQLVFRLLGAGIRSELPLGHGLYLVEAEVPPQLTGRTLSELALPRRFSVNVVMVRRRDTPDPVLPKADTVLHPGDQLVVVGGRDGLDAFIRRY